jgi:glycylpeptide N-tetradecanoyltransferase
MSINRTQVAMEPSSLLPGFEWVTMDLTKEEELRKVFELLSEHYVEDEDSEFRLDYSPSFLKW